MAEDHRATEERPWLHPLGGSNLTTLTSALRQYRPFDKNSRLVRLIAMAVVGVRFPFYQVERLLYGRTIAQTPPSPDPIFIIGHWRSGTTYLHNLMSQDSQFAWISFLQTAMPWDFLNKLKIAPPIIKKVLPETRGMDNVSLTLHSPQEEEMALGNMGPLSYYYCYYFPQRLRELYNRSILFQGVSRKEMERFAQAYRYLLKKLSLCQENRGKHLLLKNPANTARLQWLRSLFPKAKFIHIVRNPYVVFCSTLKHYRRILPAFAWQRWDNIDFEAVTLENYRLLMQRYLAYRAELPKELSWEVRFEDIEADPLGEIKKIYEHFTLPRQREALQEIATYTETHRHYRRNSYSLSRSQLRAIRKQWSFSLKLWGYDLPAEITLIA